MHKAHSKACSQPPPADWLQYCHVRHWVYVHLAVSLIGFFSALAADASAVEGLKQKGALSWCINDSSPHKLAQDLMYLTVSRALPIASVKAIQKAFSLTKASPAAYQTMYAYH